MATGACRFFTIRQRGFVVRFHPANLSSQLWIDPSGRDESLAFFRDYLKPGDLVVDVGSNIGDTVLAAAVQVGPSGHVIGLEPHPRTFQFLQDNITLNDARAVELLNVAAGSSPGSAQFSDGRRDDMNRIDGGTLQVTVERLDNLIHRPGPIALLKVDVEGYERHVFEGAPQVLQRTRCVHFEVSSLHFARFGYTTRDARTRRYKETVRALVDALSDPSPTVRFWAAFALGAASARTAVPALQRLAATDEAVCPGWWRVADEAADALVTIAGGSPPERHRAASVAGA